MQQEKISTAERSWTNPLNALQQAIRYYFIKFCIYCFSLRYEFFVHCALRVEKNINMVLMRDLWNVSFLGRGDVSPTHSELCRFVSGSQAKHQLSSPVIILFKKLVFIGHRDNGLARCDSIFPLFRCQGVWIKTCTQLSLSQILFQIRRSKDLVMFKDSAIILGAIRRSLFDQNSNSSNVYLSSSRFWMATSLIIFCQLPSVSKSRIPPKKV